MLNLLRSTVYVRVKPDRLSVLHLESGKQHSDAPTLAVEQRNGKSVVLGVGGAVTANSGMPRVVLANGFKHPRTIIADFTIAEQTLKHFLKIVLPHSLFAAAPIVVIHPLAQIEGGLTQVEIRALAELGLGAGARKVFVWEGPELSKEELHELKFSRVGGKLLYPQPAG